MYDVTIDAMSNVPSPGFIGRSLELQRAVELIDVERLVTIAGPGGIGKTRLAREIVANLDNISVHWSSLGGIRRSTRIDEAVALDLGLSTLDDHPSMRSGERILVLDNCEHVHGDAQRVVRLLLDADPSLRIVTTSRLPLDLFEEQVIQLGPLDCADQLFRARAHSIPQTSGDDRVAELCNRLDGSPLAIELAAARTRSMSPGDILRHLEDGLDVISSGGPDRPERHRRLADTVTWSNDLLSDRLQQIFHRLGAFTTDFNGEDAHVVVGDLTGSSLATAEAIDELVAHSLIVHAQLDRSRFSMLETIRAYCRARLAERAELAAVEESIRDCVAATADELFARGKDRWPLDMILDTVVAFPAIRDCLEQTIERDDVPERSARLLRVLFTLAHEAQAGDIARLGTRFANRWGSTEVRRPEATRRLVSEALGTAATASFTLQRYQEAERLASLALSSSRTDRDLGHLMGRWVLGRLARDEQHPDKALDHFTHASSAARAAGSRAAELQSEVLRAQAIAMSGDRPTALSLLTTIRSDALSDDLLINAIHAATTEGYLSVPVDLEAARLSATAAIALAGQFGVPHIVGENLRTLGVIALCEGDLQKAADHLRHALAFYLDGTIDDEMWTTVRWIAEYGERIGEHDTAALLRATADVHGRGIPLVCPPPSCPQPSAAVDLATALEAARQLVRNTEVASTESDDRQRAATWMRNGPHWVVGIDGNTTTLRDSKGVRDIAELLARPATGISVADLAEIVIEHDVGPAFDEQARRAIEDRIRERQEMVEEAELNNDLGRLGRAQEELDALIDEFSRAHGLAGRSRPQHDAIERARSAVTARIRSTIKRLYDVDRPLATHLDHSISTGRICEYRPEHTVEWQL